MNDQELNLKFVQEVEKREVLYNYNLPEYSRRDITDKAWREVAAEVNITPAECREKWRNLRTVFTRKMKPLPPGSARRKTAYYLADAMQFCVPFLKSCYGNSPLIPKQERSDNSTTADDKGPLRHWQSPSTAVQAPSPSPPASPNNSKPQQTPNENSNKPQLVSEQYEPDCPEAKIPRLETTHEVVVTIDDKVERKQAIKMFLLSLMPELEEFTDYQIKLFKRKVFSIIDEISPPSVPQVITLPDSLQTSATFPVSE